MEVILLEKIRNLGNIGDKATVKGGYARNYLIPSEKAVAATKDNIEKFAKMRDELEKNASAALKTAQDRSAKLTDMTLNIPMQATEEGKLFGSVSAGTIVQALEDVGIKAEKSEVSMPQGPIRQVGEYEIVLMLHTDVTVKVKVNVTAIVSES